MESGFLRLTDSSQVAEKKRVSILVLMESGFLLVDEMYNRNISDKFLSLF